MTAEAQGQPGLALAKINLDLRITGRRDDGFHLLQSLVVFANFGDVISASPAKDISLNISGPFGEHLAGADNLAVKAAHALRGELKAGNGAALHLQKNIPPSSGLGGGSADAAATLRILQALWGRNAAPEKMAALALALGADVPVCLLQRPAIMRGIGEKLEPLLAFPALHMVLVNPGVHVATPDVFKALEWQADEARKVPAPPLKFKNLQSVLEWLLRTGNDLQAPATAIAPKISETLAALGTLKGCRIARMSGSGATCFGLFDTASQARSAAIELRASNPDWWTRVAETLNILAS